MRTAELLVEAFERVGQSAWDAADGLDPAQLAWRPRGAGNSIGWLVWHLTRVQDDHVADVAGDEQVWTSQGWVDRFALPLDVRDIGYGHSSDDVAVVLVASVDLLTGYLDAVRAKTRSYVAGLADADLDRVVDRRWDPPVTLGVRLVSVISDDLQHAGQAAYLRGILPTS